LWSTFWREFGTGDRCFVPGDGRGALDEQWALFAKRLPHGAQVIDLGCGAGIVGRTLLGHRPDLRISGVDCALVPARSQANLTIHTSVKMEALPFPDRSFDAATSQFGIEYGSIVDTARELGRVLKPGAAFCFLVHHRDSEIVREGGTRRQALRALTSGEMMSAFLSGDAAGVDRQKRRLGQAYPSEPMIELLADYFHRTIAQTRAERQSVWQQLADQLDPEISLLLQLERSAKSAVEMGSWLVPLLTGMTETGAFVVRRKSGEPIAWAVHGAR
jgi:ubiquinone/menaquinone biosynthesis C-methylase UbiE